MLAQKLPVTVHSIDPQTAKGKYVFARIDDGGKLPCSQIKPEDWTTLIQRHNAGTLTSTPLVWQSKGKGKGYYRISTQSGTASGSSSLPVARQQSPNRSLSTVASSSATTAAASNAVPAGSAPVDHRKAQLGLGMSGSAVLRCNEELPYLSLEGSFGKGQNKQTFRIKLSLGPKTANQILNHSALGDTPGAKQVFIITETKSGTRLAWQDGKQQFTLQGFDWNAQAHVYRQRTDALLLVNGVPLSSAQPPIIEPTLKVIPSQIQAHEPLVGTRGRKAVQAGSTSRQVSRSSSASGRLGMAGQYGAVRIGIVKWGLSVDIKPSDLDLGISGYVSTLAGHDLFFYSGARDTASSKVRIVLDPHVAKGLPARLPENSIAILETMPGNMARLQWVRAVSAGRVRYTTDFLCKPGNSGFYTQLMRWESAS